MSSARSTLRPSDAPTLPGGVFVVVVLLEKAERLAQLEIGAVCAEVPRSPGVNALGAPLEVSDVLPSRVSMPRAYSEVPQLFTVTEVGLVPIGPQPSASADGLEFPGSIEA